MIQKFHQYNESNENKTIDRSNFLELKDKIEVFIANLGNEELVKGFRYTKTHFDSKDDFDEVFINKFFRMINSEINANEKDFWDFTDKGYSGYRSEGDKYKEYKDYSVKDLVKFIRKDIKLKYPDWKFSIRYDSSIRAEILSVPYNPFTPEYIKHKSEGASFDTSHYGNKKYIEQFEKDMAKIKSMGEAYNFDDSDGMIDYFHKNYYFFLTAGLEIEEQYIPNSPDVLRSKEFDAKWEERKAQQKAIADQQKGKLKRGDIVIYNYSKSYGQIPVGEYEGVIKKSPNGRGIVSDYVIDIKVDKLKQNDGSIKMLNNPRIWTVHVSTAKADTELRLKDKPSE